MTGQPKETLFVDANKKRDEISTYSSFHSYKILLNLNLCPWLKGKDPTKYTIL